LENRFFFVPGFPVMAHPMISDVIQKLCKTKVQKFRKTLLAQTSENTLITQMKLLPPHIELSSLPIFRDAKAQVELSLIGDDVHEVEKYFSIFTDELDKRKINYKITSGV
ncbi:MAG: competence/damage-inducible protein A, partial [Epsilonproteobacteria bacterium]|nr:competence/damage-inducible protein A [Campylobacterota bacterium]